MELIYTLRVRVSAPTKTTTGITVEVTGLNATSYRTGASVQRPLEEALAEFGQKLRPALLKECRWARAKTSPLPPAVEDPPKYPFAEPAEPEESAGPLPDAGPLFVRDETIES